MVTAIIRDCPPSWEVGLFMNGILVRLPQGPEQLYEIYNQVKIILAACLISNCGNRPEDVIVYVKMGRTGDSFIMPKSNGHLGTK